MAYATVADLVLALHTRVTPETEPALQACLDAAAGEIDGFLDRLEPFQEPYPPEVVRANVNRAAEWFKATDAAQGSVGYNETGTLDMPLGDGFGRHAWTVAHLKEQWGAA